MALTGRLLLGVALVISVLQVANVGERALPLLVISLLVTGLALSLAGDRVTSREE